MINNLFCEDLYNKMISSFANSNNRFLLWGISEECFALLRKLKSNNLDGLIVGLVDDRHCNKCIIDNINVYLPNEIPKLDFDVLVITVDKEKETVLRRYNSIDNRIPKVIISGTKHLQFDDEDFYKLKSSCLVKSYATGYDNTLIHIYQTIKYLYAKNIKGDVAEFGIFKGGTISFTRKILDFVGYSREEINVYGFDCFSGFPERESILDMYSNPKCEYRDYNAVKSFCDSCGIRVIEGNIKDTYTVLSDSKLMLTFFDTDNYTPVKAALEYCYDRTLPGGAIIFDHYTTKSEFIETIGERIAAEEILSDKKMFHLHDTGVFIKI